MIIPGSKRAERRFNATPEDQRIAFERDRDRVLYSSAFRRLAGITQIVRTGEADVFHNRLVHTVKVAQVGRRLAQYITRNQPTESKHLGVDPEVVEAACLAHDLGHPPFGHCGEQELHKLVEPHDPGGFEGNAQTFRIITKLAVRFEDNPGMDLTRATLAACIKYPWMRQKNHAVKSKKWNAYPTEADDFKFARQGLVSEEKTAEAELMDWADDIAYSVHDLEDFHRVQFLPWRDILSEEGKQKLVTSALEKKTNIVARDKQQLEQAHAQIGGLIVGTVGHLINEPYEGTREQRRAIRLMTSQLIGHFLQSTKLRIPTTEGESCLDVPSLVKHQIAILKQITWDYILSMPALAAQQMGQKRILRELYEDLYDDGGAKYLPRKFAYLFDTNVASDGASRSRLIADCICSLTEAETVALHARLRGLTSGSVLDPIVR